VTDAWLPWRLSDVAGNEGSAGNAERISARLRVASSATSAERTTHRNDWSDRQMPSDARATPPNDFPSPEFPTIFADNAGSLVNSASIVKFFLSRFDPSYQGDGRFQQQAVAQVIMPVEGFGFMFVFFEAQIRAMINRGFITEAQLAQWRSVFQSPGENR
jgi:hypothetical protein